MGPLRHTPSDLEVDITDLSFLQTILPDETLVNLSQSGGIEVDPKSIEAPIGPGQVSVPVEELSTVGGGDLVDPISKKEAPVIHRNESLFLRNKLAVEIDGAHGDGFLLS
jgi:hypothetical protein